MTIFHKGLLTHIIQKKMNKKRFFMPRSTIKDVLNDIEKNVTADYEIIVIANSRDRSLIDFVTTDPRITKFVLNSVNPGVARSWNMGAEMSEGEHLCFVSDDVRIGKNAIEQITLQYRCTRSAISKTFTTGISLC
jgi:glycosyltransferase involved in cell wall biosynthesis